jgi:SAM-dependent methyltransferase
LIRTLFTLSIFVGSFLLFLIQPMAAKMVLPNFGGTPAVWNTSLVFFQAALLAGYAYAHFVPKWIGARNQAILHVLLLAAGLLYLPFAVPQGFNPSATSMPEWADLLKFLTLTIGLPYFLIAAGAPMLQKWFSKSDDPAAKDPYFLYAASNIGSLLALLAYPIYFEREFALGIQADIWKFGYFGLIALLLVCALSGFRNLRSQTSDSPLETDNRQRKTDNIPWATRLRWILLAAVPSSLLIGVTNYLTTNVAAIPLLWVIPLALYLITYVFAFRSKPIASSFALGRWTALLLAPLSVIMVLEATEPFIMLAAIHLLVFVLGSLSCHSELSETRPEASHLTEFYLWISVGGVTGGIFSALVASAVFQSLAEYPIALVALAALSWRPGTDGLAKKDWFWVSGIAASILALFYASNFMNLPANQIRTGITMGVPAVLCFLQIDRPLRYALSLGVFFFLAGFLGLSTGGRLIFAERSFFGVHRIVEPDGTTFRQLTHGNTIHGRQNLKPQFRKTPLTYYHPTGPIGETMTRMFGDGKPAEVGLVGLGVGSLAAYAKPGQHFTYFEIDPVVIKIARDPNLFSFLADCKGRLDIVEGDARISLVSEQDSKFDLLVLDAFSSDSIPVHLLTLEALDLYLKKLRPNGVLAFHISNRYLNLSPILAGSAESKNLFVRYWDDTVVSDAQVAEGKTVSQWFLMARTDEDFKAIDGFLPWSKLGELTKKRPWTDARSNLLEAWITGNEAGL